MALTSDDNLLAGYTQNIKKTHSQRLLPLIDAVLKDTGTEKGYIGAVAVAAGPGSFTGLRIGVATARGLARGLNISAVGVSTLEALAENIPAGKNELICPALDARRDQVYTALYSRPDSTPGGEPGQLLEPSALSVDELMEKLRDYREKVYFPGDALQRYGEYFRRELGDRYGALPPSLALNSAASVCRCALRKMKRGTGTAAAGFPLYRLQPFYLRVPGAERRCVNINREAQY